MLPLLAAASLANVDVSFVPTESAAARAALEWASVGPGDTLFELGCGDGRVAAEALDLGASVVCVERDPELAAVAATRLLRAAGSRPERVQVITTDLFEVDLSEASVVFLFLLPGLNARLRPTLTAQLRPGARVLSAEFQVLGWPCGDSLRTGGATFHKWQLPVAAASVHATEEAAAAVASQQQQQLLSSMGGSTPEAAAVEPYIPYTRIEEAAVEHQLDCVSEDAALDGVGDGEEDGEQGDSAGERDREL